MATLPDVLKTAGFSGLTDEEALAYGSETVVLSQDDRQWTNRGVAKQFNSAMAGEAIYAAMVAAGLNSYAITYAGEGLPLSDSQVQLFLQGIVAQQAQLVENNLPETIVGQQEDESPLTFSNVATWLINQGVTHGTRWASFGLETPSLEQITAARAAIVAQDASSFIALLQNEILGPAQSEGKTKAEVIALVQTAIEGA